MLRDIAEPLATKTYNWATCFACKQLSKYLVYHFDSWLAKFELTLIGDAICMFGLVFSEWKSSICPKIVRQQFKEAIYPVFIE
jgi:hypothetical protein